MSVLAEVSDSMSLMHCSISLNPETGNILNWRFSLFRRDFFYCNNRIKNFFTVRILRAQSASVSRDTMMMTVVIPNSDFLRILLKHSLMLFKRNRILSGKIQWSKGEKKINNIAIKNIFSIPYQWENPDRKSLLHHQGAPGRSLRAVLSKLGNVLFCRFSEVNTSQY